jgi:outer membrane protein OmpA-like peptidoglycan-associated protein
MARKLKEKNIVTGNDDKYEVDQDDSVDALNKQDLNEFSEEETQTLLSTRRKSFNAYLDSKEKSDDSNRQTTGSHLNNRKDARNISLPAVIFIVACCVGGAGVIVLKPDLQNLLTHILPFTQNYFGRTLLPELPLDNTTTIVITYEDSASKITKTGLMKLDNLAGKMIRNPGATMKVSGYTDSEGSYAFNLWYSGKMVDQVKKYLLNKGVASHRIESIGKGPATGIAGKLGQIEGQSERRVEIEINFLE